MNLNISPVGFGRLHIRQDKTTREFISNKAQYSHSQDPDELKNFRAALHDINAISGDADVYMRYDINLHALRFSFDEHDDEVRDIAKVDLPYRPSTTSAEKYYRQVVRSFQKQFGDIPMHVFETNNILNLYK